VLPARIAKVYTVALDMYRDPAKVRDFLRQPHVMLDNKAPLDVALATGPGADAVSIFLAVPPVVAACERAENRSHPNPFPHW
jgi:putative toxin-antitoxin system antitoxin component (TIGR02293 family)